MFSKPLAFGLLAVACIVAAAGGGYIATRYNATGTPVGAASPVAPTSSAVVPPSPTQPAGQAPPAATAADLPAPAPVNQPSPTAATTVATPAPTAARSSRTPAKAPVTRKPRAAERADRAQSEAQPPPPASQAANVPPPAVPPPVPVETQPDKQAPPPPEPVFDELVVPADSVIGLQLGAPISSDTARIEDSVEARVTRDVTVGGRIAIPAGSRVLGSVTLVERGGKLRARGRLGLRFHTLLLADGTRTSINTDAVYREGEAPGGKSAAKIGGAAIGGAILGAIIGGGKGAAIGSSVGAGAGTAAVMAGDSETIRLPAGTILNVRLLSPTTITVER
jgi:type IV secretory pathway VirB10-like protein